MDRKFQSNNKFASVADEYSQRFGYPPYYNAFIGFLEKYCSDANLVMEIGAAGGIVAEKWDAVSDKPDLCHYSVEPVGTLFSISLEKAAKMTMRYKPQQGSFDDVSSLSLTNPLDCLILSRILHEVYLQYDRDSETFYGELDEIVRTHEPKYVITGIIERFEDLTEEETARFQEALETKIGHSHDPATDYLDFDELVSFMGKKGYNLLEDCHLTQPLPGFDPSPWRFGIGVFRS